MRSKIGYISPPLMSISLLVLGTGFFLTFLSVKLQRIGATDLTIGVILSLYFTGQLLGAFIIEPLFRYVGHIRAFATTASVTVMTILLMGLSDSLALWGGMRFIAGFCLAVQYVVVESWLLYVADKLTRGRVLAFYMIVLYVSLALSQLIIDYIDIDSLQAFIISSIFAASSVLPICFSPHESPKVPDVHSFTFIGLMKKAPLGLVACVLSGAIMSCIYGFTPLFAISYEIPVSWLMFTTVAGGVLLQWPIGKLSDIMDRRVVLMSCSAILIVPVLLVWFYPENQTLILICSFVIGGISFTIYPLSIAEASDRFHADHMTGIATVMLIAYEVGSIIGPLSIPGISYFTGIVGIYLYYALLSFALFLFALVRIVLVKSVPLQEQQGFVTLPRVTPVAYELDPRSDEANS